MAAFNFPNSPSTNDIHNENGVSWKWNGAVWKKIGDVANTFDQINVTGISTFAGDVSISDKIIHTGDTNTAVRFPSADTIQFETAGSARLQINDNGKVLIATTTTSEAHANQDELIIGSSSDDANHGLTIVTPDDRYGTVAFSDGSGGNSRGLLEYNHSGDYMRIYTAAGERFRIDSSGRHGINVTNTGDYYSAADDLIIREKDGGDSGLTIRTGTANSGLICFADGASSSSDQYRRGQIRYHHNSDSMDFTTAGNTAKVTIDSSGRLLVGTSTAAGNGVHVLYSTVNSAVEFQNNTTGTGSGQGLYVGNSTSNIGYLWNYANDALVFATNNVERFRINNIGIGTFKGNLTFGANSKAQLFENGNQQGVQSTHSSSSAHLMTHDGNEDIHVDPSGYIKFEVGGSERLRIYNTNAANTGIAKFTSPASGDMLNLQNSTGSGQGLIFGVDTSASPGYTYWKNNTSASYDAAFIVGGSERLRIKGDGKVGIATDNPYAPLSLRTAAETSSSGNFADNGILLHAPGATDEHVIPISASFVTHAYLPRCGIGFISHPTVDPVQGYAGEIGFYTHDAADGSGLSPSNERMRITRSGRVGIGEVSPDSSLHISADSGQAQVRLQRSGTASDGNDYGRLYFESTTTLCGQLSVARESAENNGYFVFKTASGGTLAERMRIKSDGVTQLKGGVNLGIQELNANNSYSDVADDSSTPTMYSNTNVLVFVSAMRQGGGSITYPCALFHIGYGGAAYKITDAHSTFSDSDTDNKICVYKTANGQFKVKNRVGTTNRICVFLIHAQGV